ncbi:hypothetical protein FRAAL4554 [Frankia alni ACN14a]|uniref:Uncharacterized protein n=1 Tax=Frankia alni (strain DSM 45986 / CECT 9034 / ACN14a) TaxID=326424 RepID=Q0RH37_FRAAA|nr:hypothetical protein FRAAL4554 [Frankia alni ACN14a]
MDSGSFGTPGVDVYPAGQGRVGPRIAPQTMP